jgi:hypothetical protein
MHKERKLLVFINKGTTKRLHINAGQVVAMLAETPTRRR